MKRNQTICKALALLKEWQGQLGKGDRPDIDACIKELERKQRALLLDVPRGEVTALLVAIHKHAHSFLVGAQQVKDGHKLEIDRKTCAAWEKHGAFLNSLKADIKRQAGIV